MADCFSSGSEPSGVGPSARLTMGCAFLAWLLATWLATPSATGQRQPRHRSQPKLDLSLFAHSEQCLACHNSLGTVAGADVSIGAMWQATMMANSSRDPYWQASVRREIDDHPSRAAEVQDECAACHMPMSRRIAFAAGAPGGVFAHLPPRGHSQPPLDRLAVDGVSCTVCHQIAAATLGGRESFNANFVLQGPAADGARPIFGPHDVDDGRKTIMRSVTGFVQTQAPHIRQSELCATCHTLITETLDEDGNVIGGLPEQMNYQEWLHSDFQAEQRSCQSCHMPPVPGPVRISSVLGDWRDELARHSFVGGNAYMLRLLNRYRDELGVAASAADLETMATATLRQLQEDTATVDIVESMAAAGQLAFTVDVWNHAGHKFPTGYPSRRAWLHVTVRDGAGAALFESGAIDATGSIHGNDNDRDPLAFEPHYQEIEDEDQVQIYEPVLGDRRGRPTTGLLTATHYLKDNRLLPRGFDKTTAEPDIAVHGGAAADQDFAGGSDAVRYRISVPRAGPYTIDVELRYQPIGYRWAHNLRPYEASETRRFVAYFDATSAESSVVVASATARVPRSEPR